MNLTDAERARLLNPELAAPAEGTSYSFRPVELPIDLDSDQPPTMPWRSGTAWRAPWRPGQRWYIGRQYLTLERCNAVRCAAADGLTYQEIADLFTFVSGKSIAHRHAVGDCRHEDGIPPVVATERVSGKSGAVTAEICEDLRRRYERGETCKLAGAFYDLSESAAYRHIAGKCKHGRPADT